MKGILVEGNKNYIYGAVALAALALIVFGSMLPSSDEDSQESARDPSSVSTEYVGDPGVQGPSADDSAPSGNETGGDVSQQPDISPKGLKVPPEAKDTAALALKTYTQFSYTDPNPNSWRDRLSKISTNVYIHSLDDTFGNDASDANYWATEIVPTRRETKTRVLSVVLDDGKFTNTPSEMTFVVTYVTAVRSVDYPNWTDPEEQMSQFVTVVRKRGTWLVDDIVPTRIPS